MSYGNPRSAAGNANDSRGVPREDDWTPSYVQRGVPREFPLKFPLVPMGVPGGRLMRPHESPRHVLTRDGYPTIRRKFPRVKVSDAIAQDPKL